MAVDSLVCTPAGVYKVDNIQSHQVLVFDQPKSSHNNDFKISKRKKKKHPLKT